MVFRRLTKYIAALFLVVGTAQISRIDDAHAASKKNKSNKTVSKKADNKRKPVYTSRKSSKSRSKVQVVSRKTSVQREIPRFFIREVSTPSQLETVQFSQTSEGTFLKQMPNLSTKYNGRLAGYGPNGEIVYFSVDSQLQSYVKDLVAQARASHIAVVAMDPSTGRILAMADRSNSIDDLSLHAGFPAASLFKVVTTTAALERAGIQPSSLIRFRGGNYTLNELNYRTDDLRDKRVMTVAEGLGKSCNPVFARLALNHLNAPILRHYAGVYGFNTSLDFDVQLPQSTAYIPAEDYDLTRAAAGFGDVFISPVHAAVMMSQIATGGVRPRPILIDTVVARGGNALAYKATPIGKRVLRTDTAETLLDMMESTTTVGTSRKEFMHRNRPVLPNIRVAAKTGTLSGSNPVGLNHWFIAAAPIENPQIALAIIVVDSANAESKASRIGRKVIEKYLVDRPHGKGA